MKEVRLLYFTCSVLITHYALLTTQSYAQRFGNEWINYQQTYFKIPVAQKGIYRISTAELRQAGLDLNNVNPAALQLFFRGQEQAIFVQGEADGRMDEGDF
nr:hypothetical protein [Spirosomataceae bacterium]